MIDEQNYTQRIEKAISILNLFRQVNDETIEKLNDNNIKSILINDNIIYDLIENTLKGDDINVNRL